MDINYPHREFRQGLIKYRSSMISASKNSERGKLNHVLKGCSRQIEVNGKLEFVCAEQLSAQFFLSPPSELPTTGVFFRDAKKNMTANRLLDRTGVYLGSAHSMQFLCLKFNELQCNKSSDQKQHSQDLPVLSPTAGNKQRAF